MTFTEFAQKHGITSLSTKLDSRTDGYRGWEGASHWRCSLSSRMHEGQAFYSPEYSMGSAHTGEPKLEDLLYSLHMDCTGVLDSSFEEWADEFGYDSDSRKAERIYKLCRKTLYAMRSGLEPIGAWEDFLACEEE